MPKQWLVIQISVSTQTNITWPLGASEYKIYKNNSIDTGTATISNNKSTKISTNIKNDISWINQYQ